MTGKVLSFRVAKLYFDGYCFAHADIEHRIVLGFMLFVHHFKIKVLRQVYSNDLQIHLSESLTKADPFASTERQETVSASLPASWS